MHALDPVHGALLAELAARGTATSAELQSALKKSQPTVSRLLAELSAQVVRLGQARSTRYAVLRPIFGHAAQQPLWWVDEAGTAQRIGTLSLLGDGSLVHVAGWDFEDLQRNRLPWYLASLKPQGFLGRLLAQRLASAGLGANPESWGLEATLFAALNVPDAPGAIVLGERTVQVVPSTEHRRIPDDPQQAGAMLDELAADVGRTLPAGLIGGRRAAEVPGADGERRTCAGEVQPAARHAVRRALARSAARRSLGGRGAGSVRRAGGGVPRR